MMQQRGGNIELGPSVTIGGDGNDQVQDPREQQAQVYSQQQYHSQSQSDQGEFDDGLESEEDHDQMNQRQQHEDGQVQMHGEGDDDRDGNQQGDGDEDDASSMNSIPDADIDFTLTYALHTFIATVEGQASVIKGDSLILLDDANSYWWLVRVLKTDEVGYIPAENIETPFERLARLNKHRNVDLATATAEENHAAMERERTRGWPNESDRIQLPPNSPSASSSTSGEFVSSSVGHANASRRAQVQAGQGEGMSGSGLALARRKSVVFAQQLTREHPGRIIEDSEDDSSDSGDEIDGSSQGQVQGLIESDRSQDDVHMEGSDTSDEDDIQESQAEAENNRVEQDIRPSAIAALAGGGAGTAAAVARAAGQGQHHEHPAIARGTSRADEMEPDDGMSWDEGLAEEEMQRRQQMGQQVSQGQAGRSDSSQRQTAPLQPHQQQDQQRALGVGMAQPPSLQVQQAQLQAPPMQQTVSGPGRARSSSIGAAGRTNQATRPTVQIDTNVTGNRVGTAGPQLSGLKPSGSQTNLLDPMDALDAEPRRISATPPVAQGNELDRIMGIQAGSNRMADQRVPAPTSRKASAASVQSHVSSGSHASGRSSDSPDSPTDEFGARGGKRDKGSKSKRGMATESETDDGSIKKKKGVFGTLFKKKDKRDKNQGAGIEGGSNLPRSNSFGNDSDSMGGRASDDESLLSGVRDSPERSMLGSGAKPGPLPRGQYASPASLGSGASASSPTIVSPHGLRLQQIDQQQQALYQQYMAKSPTSAPEDASRAYGTQAAATVAQSSAAQRLAFATSTAGGRPGSIMLTPNPHGPGGPMLNVMRIFAGQEVDSQSSFKTVLISDSTIAQDLVKQAVQRFGLKGPGPVQNLWEDYFLTVKGAEGEEYALEPGMKPLEALNEMAKLSGHEDADYLHQVRRSSIGSISSLNSNLSMHPAISSKLNDFSDDSAVKLYLHRKGEMSSTFGSYGSQLSSMGTITQSTSNIANMADRGVTSDSDNTDVEAGRTLRPSPLAISGYSTGADKQPSPSSKFTIQIFISAKDLPDTMCFDPQGDLPVYKSTVRNRNSTLPPSPSAASSMGIKRKLLVVARNVTAGEAVEQGLEVFKIMDGVVGGGDDIEDRVGKRRSVVKVRYGLEVRRALDDESGSGMMKASHAILDAYQTQPKIRMNDRIPIEARRRSREWSQNGATDNDIQASDPVFVLRKLNNRLSGGDTVPLDDVALRKQKLQEEAERASLDTRAKQEMIAAQRAASRANQQALLTAHANTSQGVDVVVPNNGTLRSAKVQIDGAETMRYSYIDGEGETYDISSLVEDELGPEQVTPQADHLAVPGQLRRMDTGQSAYVTAPSTPMSMQEGSTMGMPGLTVSTNHNDLLQDVMDRSDAGDASERVQAVLARARGMAARGPDKGPTTPLQNFRMVVPPGSATTSATSPSANSVSMRAVSPTASDRSDMTMPSRDATLSPTLDMIPASIRQAVAEAPSRSGSRQAMNSPQDFAFRSTSQQSIRPTRHRHQPSITSILSQISEDGTQRDMAPASIKPALDTVNASPPLAHAAIHQEARPVRPIPKVPMKLDDEEDIRRMMASIQARAESMPLATVERPHIEPLDRLLYGEKLDMAKFHPSVQKEWGSKVKEMEDMSMEIDALIAHVVEQQRRGNHI